MTAIEEAIGLQDNNPHLLLDKSRILRIKGDMAAALACARQAQSCGLANAELRECLADLETLAAPAVHDNAVETVTSVYQQVSTWVRQKLGAVARKMPSR